MEQPMTTKMIKVWDVGTDQVKEVPVSEAAAGLVRYARSLGPGTPAAGAWERRAIALLKGEPE
jgi:hypothetical protein